NRILNLEYVASFPGVRALAWDGDQLYASRGYTLLRGHAGKEPIQWCVVAGFRPSWWRRLTSCNGLTFRLMRDGFHALAVHPRGNLIAAVPGAIVTLGAGEKEFRVTRRILRGTRPLHIVTTPGGGAFWGEYFDNPERAEVHIYASTDGGRTWDAAHTFPRGAIRHVHNILYDGWEDCLWILTGDYGRECRIIRASLNLRTQDEVLSNTQQARAVGALVTKEGLFFASDTPLEQNYIYHLDRRGQLRRLAPIPSSSIYACRNRGGMFFSTMVEPSVVSRSGRVRLYGSADGCVWDSLAEWRKDGWPMALFQYGNAFLPDGENRTNLLAVSTIAVANADLQTSIWRTE